jgi:hypothetical protein
MPSAFCDYVAGQRLTTDFRLADSYRYRFRNAKLTDFALDMQDLMHLAGAFDGRFLGVRPRKPPVCFPLHSDHSAFNYLQTFEWKNTLSHRQ